MHEVALGFKTAVLSYSSSISIVGGDEYVVRWDEVWFKLRWFAAILLCNSSQNAGGYISEET